MQKVCVVLLEFLILLPNETDLVVFKLRLCIFREVNNWDSTTIKYRDHHSCSSLLNF